MFFIDQDPEKVRQRRARVAQRFQGTGSGFVGRRRAPIDMLGA